VKHEAKLVLAKNEIFIKLENIGIESFFSSNTPFAWKATPHKQKESYL